MNIFSLFKSLPIQLILCLGLGGLSASYLPLSIMNSLYTASFLLKDILMFVLPLIITAYIWAAMVSFGNRGLVFIFATFGLVIVANMTVLWTSYGICRTILPSVIDGHLPNIQKASAESIHAFWTLSNHIPTFFEPMHGLGLGILLGVFTLILGHTQIEKIFSKSNFRPQIMSQKMVHLSERFRMQATQFLRRGFIPLLPLYVLGFVLKLSHDGNLVNLLEGYAQTFALICTVIVAYLIFWYAAASNFNVQKTIDALKNMLPAGVMGFSTMSSSATMPVTLEATTANTKDHSFSNFFIPATVNSYLTGDGVSITITSIALLLMAGQGMPSVDLFFTFSLYYCLVKFSAAGVPGGGVIVIVPVARQYLGLDDTLATMLQTIYMLQDPILTSANVMGNGAFAMVSHKLMKPFLKNKAMPTENGDPKDQPEDQKDFSIFVTHTQAQPVAEVFTATAHTVSHDPSIYMETKPYTINIAQKEAEQIPSKQHQKID